MQKTVVIDIVALSKSLIGEHTPFLKKYIEENQINTIKPVFPAVTTFFRSFSSCPVISAAKLALDTKNSRSDSAGLIAAHWPETLGGSGSWLMPSRNHW